MEIEQISYSEEFKADFDAAAPDIKDAVEAALTKLKANPHANSLRVHALNGYRPTLFKLDVLPNRSWQISFEIVGKHCTLRRLRPHKQMNRDPR